MRSIVDKKCEVFLSKVAEWMMNVDLLLICYWVVIDWSYTSDGEWYSEGDDVEIVDISDDSNGIKNI